MPDSADQTATTVAPDGRDYRFNKFGSVGKAAGFFLVTTGYIVRSALNGIEGERTFSAIIADLAGPALLFYPAVFLALLGFLIMAILKPAALLRVTSSEVTYETGGKTIKVDIANIIAVAPFEKNGPGLFGKRRPKRSIAVLASEGSNLVKVPNGVRWRSINPELPHYEEQMIDRELVEQIMADTVEAELPDDEFGRTMRKGMQASVSRQVAQLKKANPDLKALVIPLQGMPADTEEELQESLPEWR